MDFYMNETQGTPAALSELPSTTPPSIDIYDPERGIALWWLDLTFGVLFVLSIGQAMVGNTAILVLLVRYKPYIR